MNNEIQYNLVTQRIINNIDNLCKINNEVRHQRPVSSYPLIPTVQVTRWYFIINKKASTGQTCAACLLRAIQ